MIILSAGRPRWRLVGILLLRSIRSGLRAGLRIVCFGSVGWILIVRAISLLVEVWLIIIVPIVRHPSAIAARRQHGESIRGLTTSCRIFKSL